MTDLCEVVITAPDPDWLVEFTRGLVADGLCSSGHNYTPIRSIYKWCGEVHDRTEGRVPRFTPGRTEWSISSRVFRNSTRMKFQA